jgi:hypothetical protein
MITRRLPGMLKRHQVLLTPSVDLLAASRQQSNDGVDCSYGVCTYCLPIPTPSNPDAEKCVTWVDGQAEPGLPIAATMPRQRLSISTAIVIGRPSRPASDTAATTTTDTTRTRTRVQDAS